MCPVKYTISSNNSYTLCYLYQSNCKVNDTYKCPIQISKNKQPGQAIAGCLQQLCMEAIFIHTESVHVAIWCAIGPMKTLTLEYV